jgi:hypothetical protein
MNVKKGTQMKIFDKLPEGFCENFKEYVFLHNERVRLYYLLLDKKDKFYEENVSIHDFDKFSSRKMFLSYAAKFASKNFGFQLTKEEICCIEYYVDQHKRNNSHHPEHFNGTSGICNLSSLSSHNFAEMVADCSSVAEEKEADLKLWFDNFLEGRSVIATPYSKEVIYSMIKGVATTLSFNINNKLDFRNLSDKTRKLFYDCEC